MTAPWTPSDPLPHDATDEQMMTALVWSRYKSWQELAREFAAAQVAHVTAEKDARIEWLAGDNQKWAEQVRSLLAERAQLERELAETREDVRTTRAAFDAASAPPASVTIERIRSTVDMLERFAPSGEEETNAVIMLSDLRLWIKSGGQYPRALDAARHTEEASNG